MSLGGWLQEQLFERRIVVVTGRLDDDAATKAAAALWRWTPGETCPSSSTWTAPTAGSGRSSS